MIDRFIEGNKKWRETEFTEQREYYHALASQQKPCVLWIGCSDSRVAPERITNAKAGQIFVHRNIGNIVPRYDWNFATVLEYALNHLKVKDVVICGHADCGACKALDANLEHDHYIPFWLSNAKRAKEQIDSRHPAPTDEAGKKARMEEIIKENVRIQMEHLKEYPIVKAAVADGRVQLHTLYFDLDTGELGTID